MIKDTLRFIIISPEIVFVLLAIGILSFFPELSDLIATFVFNESMQWENYLTLFGVPIMLLISVYKIGDELQNPSNDENRKLLKEWPQYWMIKNRVIFSLIVSLIGVTGTFIAWVYALQMDASLAMKAILILWSAMLGSFLSLAYARLNIKDILY